MYKNPYLETESAKSKSLLKSLQKARIEAALMSPFMSNLRNLCDSDSESAPEKNVGGTRKKLEFDEASDKENFSDLDEDDLESRIRKKLQKQKDLKQSSELVKPKEISVDKQLVAKKHTAKPVTKKRIQKQKDLKKPKNASARCSLESSDFMQIENVTSKKTVVEKCRTSTSSDEDDDDGDWWKPSRKSILKLYRERQSTKVFSFLASLSSITCHFRCNSFSFINF